ncbi:putative bifunctional diguanylate cyclase/phosphodiesterase [Pistricoccus aurantiacus]|uniref:putative bifunctional diguanylate cyclase/phosphodiesterase n=1 Tax=Pistricoccus aurantiacus TaxID=1883414 RepID=UPI003630C114
MMSQDALADSHRSASYFGGLAGAAHRRRLVELMQQSLHRARQDGSPLAICSLDIDDFQDINQQLGQAGGDALLRLVAQRLGWLIDREDVMIPLGGDEFALLIHRNVDGAYLRRLLEAIRQPISLGNETLRLSMSIGVTFFPRDDASEEVLLRHATQAMYQAKQLGGNTFHFFDCQQGRHHRSRRVERRRFVEALHNDELCLYYQPQVDMLSSRVIGMEALLRWRHPEQGLMLPGEFLPSIEGSDLEILLGEWVIEQALIQLRQWEKSGLEFPISVNISPLHLLSDPFIDRLEMLLARYPDVSPERLQLEILETAAIDDTLKADRVVRRCQALNIHVSIDDFGTGFSSLIHLRKLPVNAIKIDCSFVRDMLLDQEDMAVVESIIYLANRFGHPMLAEGVETLDHAKALVERGCQLAQGYGIARPMPEADLRAWMEEWSSRQEWRNLGAGRKPILPV